MPSAWVRAGMREACNSINANSPNASVSFGNSPTSTRPSLSASSHNAGRIQSSPLVAA